MRYGCVTVRSRVIIARRTAEGRRIGCWLGEGGFRFGVGAGGFGGGWRLGGGVGDLILRMVMFLCVCF